MDDIRRQEMVDMAKSNYDSLLETGGQDVFPITKEALMEFLLALIKTDSLLKAVSG